MSKLAKKPLAIPAGVSLALNGDFCVVTGKKASLTLPIRNDLVDVAITKDSVQVTKKTEEKAAIAYAGTIFRTLKTTITGLSTETGFVFNLDLKGVGYKAVVAGSYVTLTLGYSHNIVVEIPEGVKAAVEKNTRLIISGHNKVQVMDFIRFIQKIRRKNVYKGAGVHLEGEFTLRKEVKKSKK